MADGLESVVEQAVFRLEAFDIMWTVVMVAAAFVRPHVFPQVFVRLSRAAAAAPHRTGVHQQVPLYPHMLFRLHKMSLDVYVVVGYYHVQLPQNLSFVAFAHLCILKK